LLSPKQKLVIVSFETTVSSDFASEKEVYQDSPSTMSLWVSDVSIDNIFKSLSMNMESTRYLKDDREDNFKFEELIQLDSDPWIKHLNTLWDICFEQRKPPTEDKVTQIKLGDEANPKPIFVSESLSPFEKEDLIQLIREFIEVFAWNNEDMFGLDPQMAMHRLNINLDTKLVKQLQ